MKILKIQEIIAIILFSIYLCAIFYIQGLLGVLTNVLLLLCYLFITFFFYIAWKFIKRSQPLIFPDYARKFFVSAVNILSLLCIIVGGFLYYNNEVDPKVMKEYTLSNWEKTLKFQTMIHIAHPSFYEEVKNNLEKAKEDGAVYYFEWVKPGTKENQEKFNKALGVEFNPDLYKNMSKVYGVVAQDNHMFLGLVNDKDFNVDISLDEIVEEYEKLQSGATQQKYIQPPVDISSQIVEELAGRSERELQLITYINQGLLNFISKSPEIQETIANNFANQKLFHVILDHRNEVVAEEILQSEHKYIYATYWELHFKWILDILQKEDPKWKIIETKDLFPIK